MAHSPKLLLKTVQMCCCGNEKQPFYSLQRVRTLADICMLIYGCLEVVVMTYCLTMKIKKNKCVALNSFGLVKSQLSQTAYILLLHSISDMGGSSSSGLLFVNPMTVTT